MSDSSGVLVSTRELFTDPEAVALGGFLAGYSGLTREAYALDLRQFAGWLTGHGFRLFEIRRALPIQDGADRSIRSCRARGAP